jgi:hypothetical protein
MALITRKGLSYVDSVQAVLDRLPEPGTGFNPGLMPVIWQLRRLKVSPETALEKLHETADGLGLPDNRRKEIDIAVAKVYEAEPDGNYTESSWKHPGQNWNSIKDALREDHRVDNLFTNEYSCWEYLKMLFPDRRSLICFGLNQFTAVTKIRDSEIRPERNQFIVPSPMSAIFGYNQDGELSTQCLENTGPRRFLVVEWDIARYRKDTKVRTKWYPLIEQAWHNERSVKDMCVTLLRHASRVKQFPLTMIVDSANKSLQGWFFAADKDEEFLKDFFSYALRLGADEATWTKSQFVRMPRGLRPKTDGSLAVQSVCYFDPGYETKHYGSL